MQRVSETINSAHLSILTFTIRPMADVTDANSTSEPSMEEILASIRRIIADEKEPAAEGVEPVDGGEAKEDVLELTQMVQDDGSVVDVAAPEPAVEIPSPPPAMAAPARASVDEDKLLSDGAASAAVSSLASLATTVQIERRSALHGHTPLGNTGRTLEDMVVELMRPMLKAWLDENLPGIVDRVVQREVERIARRVQE